MRRKHSIALGMNAVISVTYLILVIVYLYMVRQEHASPGEILSFQAAADELFPHLAVMTVSMFLTFIAFFSNLFSVSLLACFSYALAILLAGTSLYQYALLCIPSLLLAISGSNFCYQRKQWLLEQEEERRYLATHPRPKVKHSVGSSYMERMKGNGNNFQQPINQANQPLPNQMPYFDQNQNYYGNQWDYYQQNQQPLLPQQMYNPLQDPYAPLAAPLQQQPNYMNSYDMSYGTAPVNDPSYLTTMNQQPVATPQVNPLPQQMPMMANGLNYPQLFQRPTHSEGYFDDYGNFHSGNNHF